MRLLLLLFLVVAGAGATCGQSTPPTDSNVIVKVSLATSQREFHIGEIIPLQLAFSSSVKDRYQVNMAQYDRSGRMNYEHFSLTPSEGAVDPLPTYTGSLGGLTTHQFLTTEPWTIKLNLNEWIRFTQPGEYRLIVSSTRAEVRDAAHPLGASPVTSPSNEITLEIVAADRAWQKRVLTEALTVIDAPVPAKQQVLESYTASRRQALERLRFLGSADSTRELAKRLRGTDSDGICVLGLLSSPERDVARSALDEALADPDRPIDTTFLYAMRMINSDPGLAHSNWRDEQQRAVEKLLTALPNKRNGALAISLSTALGEAWNEKALPQDAIDKLVSQVVARFDQLPLNEQTNLLADRWEKIGSPALLPILRRYAQAYRNFPEMRDSRAYDSLELSASALQRWYELDPAGARPAIITEITRVRPRYDARVLGILPDKTLPEVDFALAEHFVASRDLDGSSNLASLIARYGTEAILPQITEKLDTRIGKWACAIQNPILAYLLRINPAQARPRIEKAIAARGKGFSACNHELFQLISEIHYDPVLEEIAVHSLDDHDPEVAMTAATMLGKFGSPAAESALWRRYASWSAQWSGHESDLEMMSGEGIDDRTWQLGLGQNLLQALATGNAWLSAKSELEHLSGLTKVRRLRQDLDRDLKIWDQPLSIFIDHNSSPYPFRATVAQYELQTMAALKQKLAQFPAGTKFFLFASQSPMNDKPLAEVREFLESQAMGVVEEKRSN